MVASEGGQPVFGDKGQPLTIEDHVGRLARDASHLFEASGGADSQGQRKPIGNNKTMIDLDDPMAIGRGLEALESGKARLGVRG